MPGKLDSVPRFLRRTRILTGVAIWLFVSFLSGWYLAGRDSESAFRQSWVTQVWNFVRTPRRTVDLNLAQPFDVAVGDPIFTVSGGKVRRVGEVAGVGSYDGSPKSSPSAQGRAHALLYAAAPAVSARSQLVYHQTPDSLQWVLRTMLPAEKRQQIAAELQNAFREHQAEILQQLRPVVEDALREAWREAERELPGAIARHREQWAQLGSTYQQDIVQREFIPLVQTAIWPVIRRRVEPLAEEVGRDVWDRVSVWRFGWRYLYDQSPLPRQDLAQREWQRFLREEAVPVLQAHQEDFLAAQREILRDLAADPAVRSAVRRSLERMTGDPEAQRLVWQLVRETTTDSPRFRAVLETHWKSSRAQAAIQLAAQRLEPAIERIGGLLFGTPEGGVTPEFARVLRNQILLKDRHWLTLEAGEGVEAGSRADASSPIILTVQRGSDDAPNPFLQ